VLKNLDLILECRLAAVAKPASDLFSVKDTLFREENLEWKNK
jgi:hypothetical protein